MSKSMQLPKHRGFSLIEVLVTMIIISLGLLGQAALMAQSAKSNGSAYMRSQATLLAYDILERMRMNRTAAMLGSFNTVAGTAAPSGTSTVVGQELYDWKNDLANLLPSGDATVTVNGAGQATVSIQWSEVSKGDQGKGAVATTTFTTNSVI